jgi:valacyclovir hydrolase
MVGLKKTRISMPYFSSSGQQLYYREQGKGRLIIILPGNTASSACHQKELAYFSSRFHTASLDLRGTGQSQRCTNWSLDWWAQGGRDALALADHLGERYITLIGTSGGSAAALYAAIQFPERISGVIADSFVQFLPPEQIMSEIKHRRQKKSRIGELLAIRSWFRLGIGCRRR